MEHPCGFDPHCPHHKSRCFIVQNSGFIFLHNTLYNTFSLQKAPSPAPGPAGCSFVWQIFAMMARGSAAGGEGPPSRLQAPPSCLAPIHTRGNFHGAAGCILAGHRTRWKQPGKERAQPHRPHAGGQGCALDRGRAGASKAGFLGVRSAFSFSCFALASCPVSSLFARCSIKDSPLHPGGVQGALEVMR